MCTEYCHSTIVDKLSQEKHSDSGFEIFKLKFPEFNSELI